jgi:hypothetical protein
LYRFIAAGRYAIIWLPEFIILYNIEAQENGDDAAYEWAIRELMLSLEPALAVRVYRAFRIAYSAWKAYRRVVQG